MSQRREEKMDQKEVNAILGELHGAQHWVIFEKQEYPTVSYHERRLWWQWYGKSVSGTRRNRLRKGQL